jgi:predicted RNA-binding protein YlxR (DUF448 family)
MVLLSIKRDTGGYVGDDKTSVKNKKNYQALHRHDQAAYRDLNDRVIETDIIVRSLAVIAKRINDGKLFNSEKISISVPSSGDKSATVTRTQTSVKELIRIAVTSPR